MTTQARLIAQKQAEALEDEARRIGLAMPNSDHVLIILFGLKQKADELRAQAEAAQPAKSEVGQGERERFEAWATESFVLLHKSASSEEYQFAGTRLCWEAWQAGSEHAYLYATAKVNSLGGKFARQAAAQPEGEKSERERFEAWRASLTESLHTVGVKHAAWLAWQAARSHQAQAVEGREGEAPLYPFNSSVGLIAKEGGVVARLLRHDAKHLLDGKYIFANGPHQTVEHAAQYIEALERALATPPTQQEALAPQDRLSRHADIVLEAIQEYDAYMLEDDFNAQTCLDKIIKRMRERFSASDATPSPQAVPEGWPKSWRTQGFNCAFTVAAKALRFLSKNPRPIGGQQEYNSEHLWQIAGEIEHSVRVLIAPPAPAKDGWISVEERLPEIDTYYLACIKPILGDAFLSINYFAKQKNPAISGWTTNKVTHWHELPLPPKS